MGVLHYFHVVDLGGEVLFEGGMLCELFFGNDFDCEGEVVVVDAVGEEYGAETATTDFLDQLEFVFLEEVPQLVLGQAVDHFLSR
jgi:hypothetical protein